MSNETRWTPGPWECVYPSDNLWPSRIFSGSKFVAMVSNSDDKQDQSLSDAHLIAAAPDMYEALDELADLMQGVIDGDFKPDSFTLQVAHAALAKARGEQS